MPTASERGGLFSPEDADLAGKVSRFNKDGYLRRDYYVEGERHTVFLHREVLARKLGRELVPSEHVDHINRNRTDNRRDNLRLSSLALNPQNSRRGAVGIMGIGWNRGGYQYRFWIDGKCYSGWHKRLKVCKKMMDERKASAGYVTV